MTLISILVGTLVAGMGSVWLAALLAYALLSRFTQHLLSLAAGALLATAFTRLLPEAFELSQEAGVSAHALFFALLVGLVFFFLLDKAELWHHGHEHGHDHAVIHESHDHGSHAHHAHEAHEVHQHRHHGHNHHSGGWAVLLGDSVHAFGDGILIAAAFVADPRLGIAAALAVMAHEVPHHVGDLVVLRQTLSNPRAALFKLTLAGGVTAIGGLVGYLLVGALHEYLPFFLVVAASSFIYVALADLIPQLQKRLSPKETAAQVAWLFAGIAIVAALGEWAQH
ncbi:MAG: ZIP family metal transporter [Burkholderiales bacterium 35-55-47]|jgi:zinc and cadmium transporter|uniref:ZIP family metal transporter n=1 Tax=Limnohabitans sp. TaxID=1907725 RepID=UPI000BDBD9FA|nr:ZIP family metal transporter [Limnohabitans sp.]OYY19258.1 MAG: ZIP family metal transporter [Burkholderiales bacterium 35-55-47]OYZ73267.1 MAG: ZIP family metal transporter [Burkholderiales bacterium 24-55-52]OZB00216.1 MAG: ZIP family metal transporter [Burkholderiales bacterium 39-55-53]HQR87584.1 ZIP family metal transporter [Limnohabitans sp.]HQS27517.1 ZIP family metal transporter [Limnohabitans sp.]